MLNVYLIIKIVGINNIKNKINVNGKLSIAI